MLSSFLFIRWRKEKEREEEDMEAVIRLSSRESSWCVILVALKGLLRRISCRDRVPSLKGMSRMDRWAFSCLKHGTLAFPLVAWSLSAGDLESLHSIGVVIPGGSKVQM